MGGQNEKLPEFKSHEMGLQVSYYFHSEGAQEADLWSIAQASWGSIPRIGQAEGVYDRGGAFAS
jgi:hypothetical protein